MNRRNWILRWVSCMMLLFAACPAALWAQHAYERLFYYVDDKDSFASFTSHVQEIDIVAVNAFSVDQNGVVWGDVDRRVVELAKRHNVRVMPYIANPGFNQEMLSAFLADSSARRLAISTLVELCRRNGYYGIQFDFENLNMRDRDAYTRFYRETAEALHRENFKLSVAVVHRPDEIPGPTQYFKWMYTNWRAGYDLKALAEIGDFISLMTYSQHTRRTPPGPNAGIPWVIKNIEYFLKAVPPEKLSLGIPFGSQHWHVVQDDEKYVAHARTWSTSYDYAWAVGKAERYGAKIMWLEDQQVPYTFFENAGLFEYIFFEDARSFRAKVDLIRKYRLRGFSAWVLGDEDPKVWEVLKAEK